MYVIICGTPERIVASLNLIGSPFVPRVGTPERDGPDIAIIILRGPAAVFSNRPKAIAEMTSQRPVERPDRKKVSVKPLYYFHMCPALM